MTTVQEISKKSGVGVWSVRKLVKAGFITATDESADAQKMKAILSKQRPLSVEHLLMLIDDRGLLLDLGRYADAARKQLDTLGEVEREAAPRSVVPYIDEASNGNARAVEVIADWIKTVLPPVGAVPYSWLASRLVFNSLTRADDLARLSLALINARQALPGWWRVEKIAGRNQTFFQKPKLALDL